MAVTIAQVRSQIGDKPRWCTAPGLREILSPSLDGQDTTFFLRFAGAILSTVRLWSGNLPASGQPPSWDVMDPADSANPWSAALDPATLLPAITFAKGPPPPAHMLATRYMTTALTDDEIQTYLSANIDPNGDDQRTLKAVHYNLIPVILNDREKLTVISIGQRREDMSNWVNAQLKIMDAIGKDLNTPVEQGIAFGWSSNGAPQYIR